MVKKNIKSITIHPNGDDYTKPYALIKIEPYDGEPKSYHLSHDAQMGELLDYIKKVCE